MVGAAGVKTRRPPRRSDYQGTCAAWVPGRSPSIGSHHQRQSKTADLPSIHQVGPWV